VRNDEELRDDNLAGVDMHLDLATQSTVYVVQSLREGILGVIGLFLPIQR